MASLICRELPRRQADSYRWSRARFSSELLAIILRAGFTCHVNITYGSLPDQIYALAHENADVLMEVWVDDVNTEWPEAQKEGSVVLLGTNFASADEGWFVRRYLVEGPNAPVPSLRSVTDLTRYKDLFHGKFLNCPIATRSITTNLLLMDSLHSISPSTLSMMPTW
jgi:glycine betaine/proline transport system substrate-binding protein